MCRICFNIRRIPSKKGFTLIELMVVVAIMGILSTLGIAGLHGAVTNGRTQDAATNIAAFLKRISNESNRLSATLRVKKTSDQDLRVVFVKEDGSDSTEFERFSIDAPMKFGCNNTDGLSGNNWATEDGVDFVPRLGLSAAPAEGYICARYAETEKNGVALKLKTQNTIRAMWRPEVGEWNKL